jgi:hypothetical protein
MTTWMKTTLVAMMTLAMPACTAETGSGDPEQSGAEDAASLHEGPIGEAAAAVTGQHLYCTTSGSYDSGWWYSGVDLDFGRNRANWSGSSVDGIGTITVNATLDGYTYGSPANPIALTGAIQINGGNQGNCASVSVVDRDGNPSATASRSCTSPWNGSAISTTTISVRDSSSGARYEFTRGADVNRFYVPDSGSSTTTCVWGN